MNVNVIWEGSDITDHVIEYTRQHDICTGIGSLDLIVEADTDFNFNPWNSIIIKEEGTQVALYNITSIEKTSPGGTYIIAAQDNSKRLTDYFIDHEYTAEALSNTRTWIELILSDAGIVSYSINTSSNGEPVTIGSQFGLKPAYDAILNLLQLSGWFMYFDSNGVCQIGELNTNKSPVHDFYDGDTLEIRTIKNDKILRNRVYVWGSFEEGTGWVTAKAETYLPWFRDDGQDWRSVVYQNSSIYYFSTATKMAEKMLSEFSRQVPEKEIHVVGTHPSLHVGVYIKSLGKYGSGVGQVTSYVVNVNKDGGATTTLIVDKRCPRIFGISDIKSEFVYIGTDKNGVWRKALDGGYWYAYNTNIEDEGIRDLTAYDGLLSTVTASGELYINNNGGWLKYEPTKFVDGILTGEVKSSGYFIASSYDISYLPDGGINAGYTTTSGINLGFELPTYIPSGNLSWVVGLTPNGSERYIHQVNYQYLDSNGVTATGWDVGILDMDTNDLGQNILSVRVQQPLHIDGTYWGSYNHAATSHGLYLGKDIHTAVPPGLDILVDDWGGQKYSSMGSSFAWMTWYDGHGDGHVTYMNPGYYSPEIMFIHEDHMEWDGGYIDGHTHLDYQIDCSNIHPLGIGDPHKFIKYDDDSYHVLGGTGIYKLHKPTESCTQIASWTAKLDKFNEPIQTYNGTYHMGTDGDFWITAYQKPTCERSEIVGYTPYTGIPYFPPGGIPIWRDVTYNGEGYIRIVNMRLGTYQDYTVPVLGDGGGQGATHYWEVTIVGYDESPNHAIVAYAVTLIPTDDINEYTTVQPVTYVHIYLVDKYTGVVRHTTETVMWSVCNRKDERWGAGSLDSCWHRHPFFSVAFEHPDGGYGFAWLHLQRSTTAYRWIYDYVPILFPHMEWRWGRVGSYYESILLKIGLPDGTVLGKQSFEDWDEGHDDCEPPIPQYWQNNTPRWLYPAGTKEGYRQYDIDTSFHAFYSREGASHWMCYGMRISDDIDNTYTQMAICDADLPTQHLLLPYTLTEFYLYDEYNDTWNIKVNGHSPFADEFDNTYYLCTSENEGTVYGIDAGGNIMKSYRGGGGGHGWWFDSSPRPLGNKIIDNNTQTLSVEWYGLKSWLGASGTYDDRNSCKILLHDPTVVPSGLFTTLYEYRKPMAVEVGLGLPTTIYDPPNPEALYWGDRNTNLIGASWTNDPEEKFPVRYPISNISDARLLDIFQGAFFPLAEGETLPNNSLSRFVGFVGEYNNIRIYNTEFESYPDLYSTIVEWPAGYEANLIDFTNYFPSPYIFVSVITIDSGQQFFQRFTETAVFRNFSESLPEGPLITIIRADDRV